MSQDLWIMGAGGHAMSVAESALSCGYEVVGFASERQGAVSLLGRPVLPAVPSEHIARGGCVAIGIGDNGARQRVWHAITSTCPIEQLPPLVHSSASVSSLATLGPGSVILQGAIVGSCAIVGIGCLVNSGAVLDHESQLGDFASLAPGAVIGGRVTIGERSVISIGAIVRHGLTIGSDTVVGAAGYVHHDLLSNVVAYGTPARIIRSRRTEDTYL